MIQNIGEFATKIALEANLALSDFKLRPPIESAELRSLLQTNSLPTEISEILYTQYDGQEYGSLKLFGEFAMLSIEESIDLYTEMVDEFVDYKMGHSADLRIRGETIWRRKWYPFGWDQNRNDHLCLDFDPAAEGTIGQVIYCPKWGNHAVHGTSFANFLDWYYTKLNNVNFQLGDGPLKEFNCRVNPFDS